MLIKKLQNKDLSLLEINMYLGIILSKLFGSTSDFRERAQMENLTSGFFVEKNNFSNFITLDITAESDKPDMFIDLVNEAISDIKISKAELERIKRVWIASEIRMIDSVELTVDNIYSDLIMYDQVYSNRIELIHNMNIKTLNKVIKNLDLSFFYIIPRFLTSSMIY